MTKSNLKTSFKTPFQEGIRLFESGSFFEAHEVWESIWLQAGGSEAEFWKGLIQAAVAYQHQANGNLRGAHKMAERARGRLLAFAPMKYGLDLSALCKGLLDVEQAPAPLLL